MIKKNGVRKVSNDSNDIKIKIFRSTHRVQMFLTCGSRPASVAYASPCGITVSPTVTPAIKSLTAWSASYLGSQETIGIRFLNSLPIDWYRFGRYLASPPRYSDMATAVRYKYLQTKTPTVQNIFHARAVKYNNADGVSIDIFTGLI